MNRKGLSFVVLPKTIDSTNLPKYLSETQVSEITGFALSTLRIKRFFGKGISCIKRGRSVRYALKDVLQYMEAGKIQILTGCPGDGTPMEGDLLCQCTY